MDKFFSHLFTNNIPAMTHILESFDPNYSSSFNGDYKSIEPILSGSLEVSKRPKEEAGRKNKRKMEKPHNMLK